MKFGSKILSLNFFMLALFFFDRHLKNFFKQKNQISINKYIAFGIKFDLKIILILTSIILAILIVWLGYAYFNKKIIEIFGISLMLFGAVNNLMDRVSYGYVIDYIYVPYFSVLNLADVMIVLGAFVLIYKFLMKENNAN